MIEVRYGKDLIEIKSDAELSKESVDELIRLIESAKNTSIVKTISESISHDERIDTRHIHDTIDTQRRRLPNKIEREITSEGTLVGNDSNVVDLSKMTIENQKVTPYDVFRCPDCGQSIIISINNMTVIRDLEIEGNLAILEEGYIIKGADDSFDKDFDYEEAKKHAIEIGVKLAGDNHNTASCPRCNGHGKLIESWVNAYKNPLQYFEFENPCPKCGSETSMIIERDSNGENMKCENESCNYTFKK